MAGDSKLRAVELSASVRGRELLQAVSLSMPAHAVTAIIGPSGCGKSTFLRCLNRTHELEGEASTRGQVFLDQDDIYRPEVDPVQVRRRVGMVFQKPQPFPRMSVLDNVISGLRLTGAPAMFTGRLRRRPTAAAWARAEAALRAVALWDDMVGRLHEPARALSAGEQQRMCIARALAVEPEVLLMDEPCSALDPVATARIEDLLFELKARYTIVIVTHNMQQAARVSDRCAFFLGGELIEDGPTGRLFTQPLDRRTEDYLTGRFG